MTIVWQLQHSAGILQRGSLPRLAIAGHTPRLNRHRSPCIPTIRCSATFSAKTAAPPTAASSRWTACCPWTAATPAALQSSFPRRGAEPATRCPALQNRLLLASTDLQPSGRSRCESFLQLMRTVYAYPSWHVNAAISFLCCRCDRQCGMCTARHECRQYAPLITSSDHASGDAVPCHLMWQGRLAFKCAVGRASKTSISTWTWPSKVTRRSWTALLAAFQTAGVRRCGWSSATDVILFNRVGLNACVSNLAPGVKLLYCQRYRSQ